MEDKVESTNAMSSGEPNAAFGHKPKPEFANADNHDLGAGEIAGFPVGGASDVNGPGAVEVPDFVPTRFELLQLADYWANVAIYREFNCWVSETVGSRDWRRIAFAWRRVERIRGLLSDEVVDNVIKDIADGLLGDTSRNIETAYGDKRDLEEFRSCIDRAAQQSYLPGN